MSLSTKSPVSHPVDVRRLPQNGFPLVIDADEKMRAALASAHGLVAVDSFHADLLVKNWKAGGISVSGRVHARIVQECVVTLEPLAAEVDGDIDAVFVPEGSALSRETIDDGELVVSADGPDLPETFDGSSIDAGAVAEEFFALGIDPYPRKQGAELPQGHEPADTDSPFARLRGIQPKS